MLAGLKARIRLALIQAPRNRGAKRMKQKEAAISFMQMVAEGKVRSRREKLLNSGILDRKLWQTPRMKMEFFRMVAA
jgi:hypothetical protein